MSTEFSFGQKYDDNGLIMPWLSHGALDEIKSMDLSDKNVLMYGAGLGDAWLAKRCKSLIVIERNEDWLYKAAENCVRNGAFVNYIHRPCNDSDGKADYYCEIPNDKDYHVIINDDAYRTEVVFKAIEYFKGKKYDGILICDNWWQDYVWKSPAAIEALSGYESHIYSQPDHTNFEEPGCEWKTAIHFIK